MKIEEILDLSSSFSKGYPMHVAEYDIDALIKMLGNKDMDMTLYPEKNLKTVSYSGDQQRTEVTVPLRTLFCAEDKVTVTGYMLRGPHRGTRNDLEVNLGNYSSTHSGVCSKGVRAKFAVNGYVGPYSSERTKAETADLMNSFNILKDILLKCNRKE
ncbi:MAG TPA: hypothetical protein HA362_01385 [Nanoarchaeota archaeon]|nr:hypothetical protein [Nanoarchaeota archaeon]